ncbi:hypothetical protein E4T43_09019 [Aureobasidium subglaciale]|nr:hypothetical protein E4T43_09019 [Aureobasidium subglaciale]
MAYNNTIPIGVIVGLVSFIILLILALRWLRHKNNQKEAREQDMEAAKVEASAFDDGASDIYTPIASPRDALFQSGLHANKSVVSLYAEPNKTGKEWSDARRAQGRA